MGTVFWFVIVTAALHFSGHWYAEYLPISDSNSYDNSAKLYNVTKILTPEFTLDEQKYLVCLLERAPHSVLTYTRVTRLCFSQLLSP